MEDLFEDGRQEVLTDLTLTISRRAKFNKECIDSDKEFAYTKEQMKAFDQIYTEIQSVINMMKTKKRDSRIMG